MRKRNLIRILGLSLVWITSAAALAEDASIRRLLYVATVGMAWSYSTSTTAINSSNEFLLRDSTIPESR